MEQCVDIIIPGGRWNDANCGLEFGGYVCKKRLGATAAPPAPTDPWPGLNLCFSSRSMLNVI